jgi:hypothetical protein
LKWLGPTNLARSMLKVWHPGGRIARRAKE